MSAQNPNMEMLFKAAIAIESTTERAAFLRDQCGDNQQLIETLQQRIASHQQEMGRTEECAIESEATVLGTFTASEQTAEFDAGPDSAGKCAEADSLEGTGHSVLQSLEETIVVPRVKLRDVEAESPSLVAPSQPPTMDGRYRVDGEIARGGMGAILKGRDTDLGRDLAIKVLLDSHKDRPEVIQRFVEEAQIGGQLQHPGIAPVYELGQFSDRRPFFSMKLVKGETLSKLLSERDSAGDERGRFLGIFEQICQTVAYAHSRGVIHRDLKPANIMVGSFGEVQVMDWGLAKVLPDSVAADDSPARSHTEDAPAIQTNRNSDSTMPASMHSETQMGSVMGTPAYMPPEQALGEIDQLDQRADVFGLGAILCEILTGKPPYSGKNGLAVLQLASQGQLDDAFQRLDTCGAEPELITLARDCLAFEPSKRPQDAGELAARVTGYLESVELRLRETELERATEAARVVEQKKRLRTTVTLAAAILLVLTCGIAGTAWEAHQAEEARIAESKRAEGEQQAKQRADEARLAAEQAQATAEALAVREREANQQAQKRLAQIEKANDILASIFKDLDPKDISQKKRPLQARLADRLESAVEELEEDAIGDPLVVAGMQKQFAVSLLSLGRPFKAVDVMRKCAATHAEHNGKAHLQTLQANALLGTAYLTSGQLELARPLLEETLALRREHGLTDDRGLMLLMNTLADTYQDLGQLQEAVQLYEEAIALCKEKLGPKESLTFTCMNNLGSAYRKLAQFDKALPLFEQTLQSGPAHTKSVVTIVLGVRSHHSSRTCVAS